MDRTTKEKSGRAFVFGTLILSFILILISSIGTTPNKNDAVGIISLSAFLFLYLDFSPLVIGLNQLN